MSKKGFIKKGGGNVFADVGLERPDEYLVKAELARQIMNAMDARGLNQSEAARVIGADRAKVSAIRNGNLDPFSTDRLLRFLTALGKDVKVVVARRTHAKRAGRLRVIAA